MASCAGAMHDPLEVAGLAGIRLAWVNDLGSEAVWLRRRRVLLLDSGTTRENAAVALAAALLDEAG